MTISETFPSWFIGRQPGRKVILTSYGDALARRFGKANRKKVEEYGPDVFGVTLEQGSNIVTNWSIDKHNGQMISAGIGGPISGEGADLLIIDDPVKNREEADSPTYREKIWDEWQNTLLTRLQPGAAVIIVLTHWHEDDLAGRLLAQEGDKWKVVSLPAEAEENDILGRQPGEPLWPAYGYDNNWLSEKKREVGTRVWNALYQQRPAAEGGQILKRHWWRYWCHPGQEKTLPPVTVKLPDEEGGDYLQIEPQPLPRRFDKVAQSWDMAFKDTKSSAYVAGQVWGRQGANKYLLDQTRDKLDFIKTIRAVESLTLKWPTAKAKWIEDKANGPAVISALRNKGKISGLIPVQPEGSKESRAHAVSPECEGGNVFLPHPHLAPWVEAFIEELAAFPHGTYADQVDAATQALLEFEFPRGKRAGTWGRL